MARRGPARTSAIKRRVGDRVRAIRERQALSQAEVARRIGTSTSQVNAVERGDRAVTIVSLEAIARALRVPLADLLQDEDAPQPPSRSELIWYRLMAQLRERDVDYLRAIEKLIKSFDNALETAGRGARSSKA